MEIPAQPAQVFDVASLVKNTGFSEQPRPEHTALVQQVSHWVCVLGGRGEEAARRKEGRESEEKEGKGFCWVRSGYEGFFYTLVLEVNRYDGLVCLI